MSQLDQYYRAFLEYRNITRDDKSCQRDRRVIKKTLTEFDTLETIKYTCIIDEDWIIAIEKGLEFVEKACQEERQFIRVNGEVVPIEKAKKISKHSVEHLAKHSNLITHIPDNPEENIVPDGIYMVEKLNDYAVYENKFLYMLLCYLRDFIALRINKINELRSTYICDFSIKKGNETKFQKYEYVTHYHEERINNPYPIPDDRSVALITRIENCEQIVNMLLNTDLMTEVSKAPMIKPPIVKTNVLKMNNNFKNALALFDYISGYSGDGYQATEVKRTYVPFTDIQADEISELVTLTEFLTYKYGNELEGVLKTQYEAFLEEKRREEEKKLLDDIARLKKRILESGGNAEAYMLALEKRNRMLEDYSAEMMNLKNEILNLKNRIDELIGEKEELKKNIEELNEIILKKDEEIAYLNQKYIDDMNALKAKHAEEIAELIAKHEDELEICNEDYQVMLYDMYDSYETKINDLKVSHQEELDNLHLDYQSKMNELIDSHNLELDNLKEYHKQELIDKEEEIVNRMTEEMNSYLEERDTLKTDLTRLNKKYDEETASYKEKVNSLDTEISNLNSQMTESINDYETKLKDMKSLCEDECTNHDKLRQEAIDARDLMSAELTAIRIEKGELTPTLEFTNKERFEELENEFEAFNKFFKDQWELTKKEIRKNLLWKKNEEKKK